MRLLETKGLTKHFGGLAAEVDVDIHVDTGEIAALIGPNGAGKTTMFNLLTGFERPTSGKVIFKGRSTASSGHTLQDRMRRYLVRASPLNPTLTPSNLALKAVSSQTADTSHSTRRSQPGPLV